MIWNYNEKYNSKLQLELIIDNRFLTRVERSPVLFSAEMPLIKSVGAANLQSPLIPRKFVALYQGNTKIRMRSDERG